MPRPTGPALPGQPAKWRGIHEFPPAHPDPLPLAYSAEVAFGYEGWKEGERERTASPLSLRERVGVRGVFAPANSCARCLTGYLL